MKSEIDSAVKFLMEKFPLRFSIKNVCTKVLQIVQSEFGQANVESEILQVILRDQPTATDPSEPEQPHAEGAGSEGHPPDEPDREDRRVLEGKGRGQKLGRGG